MTGLSRTNGRSLDVASAEHLAQSIGDILTTPVGSRVMNRAYGSDLPNLVDQPLNPRTRLRIFAATAMALLRWEPRLRLKRIALSRAGDGAASLSLTAVRTDLPQRRAVTLSIPLRA